MSLYSRARSRGSGCRRMEEGRGRVRLREGLSIGEGEHVEGRAQYTGMPIAHVAFRLAPNAGVCLRAGGEGALGWAGDWVERVIEGDCGA
jgi:hypothetical protein